MSINNTKRILITGGPVFEYLDDVKIITNKFKGGLMSSLVEQMASFYKDNIKILYLTSKDSKIPKSVISNLDVQFHNGFDDYKQKVCNLAPYFDGMLLGAAVVNLIPEKRIFGKFPSHNYKEGDSVPINFKIAPRVINMVKEINPNINLFGFKLLSNVLHDTLIDVAYETLLGSNAVTVFANDTKDLLTKYAVTKEKGVIKMDILDMIHYIYNRLNDVYYKSNVVDVKNRVYIDESTYSTFDKYLRKYSDRFTRISNELVFGAIAVKNKSGGFLTTARGKNEVYDMAFVQNVSHIEHKIEIHDRKATLNAPLLDHLFNTNPNVEVIVHLHEFDSKYKEYPYYVPGTVKDSIRDVNTSFVIKHHGLFLLLDKYGNIV